MSTIGVLAMQGAFIEHIKMLRCLGTDAVEVRLPRELDELKGLILLAEDVEDLEQSPIGVMDLTVQRNAFGRQVDSYETDIPVPALETVSEPKEKGRPFHAVFIRAPLIRSIGEAVEVLSRLTDGSIVAARQSSLLATAFHPELTDDTRFHRYFLKMVDESLGASREG
jgi:5'-phosphate synthase pdxT subunit